MVKNSQEHPLSEHQIDVGREELANAITHGFGLLLSIAGAIALITVSILHGTAWQIVSCTVYGATLVLLYLSSTLVPRDFHTASEAHASTFLITPSCTS